MEVRRDGRENRKGLETPPKVEGEFTASLVAVEFRRRIQTPPSPGAKKWEGRFPGGLHGPFL